LSVAEPVAGWALPHHGTFVRPLSRHQMTSARSACVGFGTWAASASSGVALGQADRAMKEPLATHMDGPRILRRQRAIAIYTAHVLNSVKAPTASFASKLTRYERGPNRESDRRRGRTANGCNSFHASEPASRRQADVAPTAFRSGRGSAHREELCGPAPARRTPLP